MTTTDSRLQPLNLGWANGFVPRVRKSNRSTSLGLALQRSGYSYPHLPSRLCGGGLSAKAFRGEQRDASRLPVDDEPLDKEAPHIALQKGEWCEAPFPGTRMPALYRIIPEEKRYLTPL